MESEVYSLDELLNRLRRYWPEAAKRTVHFYATKNILARRKRGRGARYSDEDLVRMRAALAMRRQRLALREIVQRLQTMTAEQIASYVAQQDKATPAVNEEVSVILHRVPEWFTEGGQSDRSPPTSWTRFQLADGVELAVRADVRERLPELMSSLTTFTRKVTLPTETKIATSERTSYSCYLANGHMVAEIAGQNVLIDTAAEFTFGDRGSLNVAGQKLEFPTAAPEQMLTTAAIRERIGINISVYLGASFLNRFDYIIDLRARQLSVAEKIDEVDGMVVPVNYVGEIPTIDAELSEGRFSFVAASGARLSLIQSTLMDKYSQFGTNNAVSRTPTELRGIPFRIGPMQWQLKFGTLPAAIEEYLRERYGAAGLLGAEFFENHAFLFSKRRNLLAIS